MLICHRNAILLTAFNIKYFYNGIRDINFEMSNEMIDILTTRFNN